MSYRLGGGGSGLLPENLEDYTSIGSVNNTLHKLSIVITFNLPCKLETTIVKVGLPITALQCLVSKFTAQCRDAAAF